MQKNITSASTRKNIPLHYIFSRVAGVNSIEVATKLFRFFTNKFDKYAYVWAKESDWAVYKSVYGYNYLYLNLDEKPVKIYSLWKKVHPDSLEKSTKDVKSHIDSLGKGWHQVRLIPDEETQRYGELCEEHQCKWKIETEEVVDFDIAHIETAESLSCPDEIYDELVQYAIKKGSKLYDGNKKS